MTEYPVYEGENVIGKICVTVQGLYYHFSCSCTPSCNNIQRLYIKTDAGCTEIGVLIPNSTGVYGVEKRLPVKQITGNIIAFFIAEKTQVANHSFYKLDVKCAFPALPKLETAYFGLKDDLPGLFI